MIIPLASNKQLSLNFSRTDGLQTFDFHQTADRFQLAEEQILLRHHPNAFFREIEIRHNASSIDLSQERSARVPHMYTCPKVSVSLKMVSHFRNVVMARRVCYEGIVCRPLTVSAPRVDITSLVAFDTIRNANVAESEHLSVRKPCAVLNDIIRIVAARQSRVDGNLLAICWSPVG